jgi:Flp pilus assembly pilin Flp
MPRRMEARKRRTGLGRVWDHDQHTEGAMKTMLKYLRDDERGIETLEWLAIAVLILIVAFAIYPGTLQTGLQTVVDNIVGKLTESSSGIGGGS